MPFNPISYGLDTLDITTSTTFGCGPGQTLPPRMLVATPTAAIKVTLPAINAVMPSPPGTVGTTPGVGDGFLMTIKNTAAYLITVTPAGSDTTDITYCPGPGTINLIASAADAKWYSSVPARNLAFLNKGVAYTLSVADRYVAVTTAVAISLPAATGVSAGQEFTVTANGVACTVTPVSGNISGVAAITLASGAACGVISDSTQWLRIS